MSKNLPCDSTTAAPDLLFPPDGLVMTNHHVGSDCLGKMSTKDKNYVAGKPDFEASNQMTDEPKCSDLELNVLMSIAGCDRAAWPALCKPGMDAASAEKARRAEINNIEKES